ncbi:MAG: hypothetical protein H7Y03_03200 [Chitinophagaceae bacterium]|nr:hypothetical protein [Chitinophagaceae bacterium]
MDIVDEDSLRPRLLKDLGGKYIDERKVQVTDINDYNGAADFILEATGIAQLQIQLIDTYLQESKERWSGIIEQVITERISFTNFKLALHQHGVDKIKVVVDWMS